MNIQHPDVVLPKLISELDLISKSNCHAPKVKDFARQILLYIESKDAQETSRLAFQQEGQ